MIPLRLFTDSPACRQQRICVSCRDQGERGERFRAEVPKSMTPPPEWQCPYGVPWGFKGDERSRGLGDTVAKAIQRVTFGKVKPCGRCKDRQAALNRLVPYKRD